MNRCQRLFAFILVILFSAPVMSGQSSYSFLKQLDGQGLRREHAAYLNSLDKTLGIDSLHYLYAKYYLSGKQDSLFLLSYAQSKSLFLSDSQSVSHASIYFLTRPRKLQARWYDSYDDSKLSGSPHLLQIAYRASIDPGHTDPGILPEQIRTDFLQLQKADRHKPWKAALLSAAVPGLGKLYVGRKRSFINTFLSQASYAIGTYASYRAFGPTNALTLISAGMLTLFYSANIYGSFHEVKLVKNEKRKQFLIHASDYYNFNCANSLYP
jgi:hypothetical protein